MKIVSINKDDAILFDNEIMKTPAFVKFHAPWCGHCQALEPEWKQMGEELNEECSDDILLIDVHHEAMPNIKSKVTEIVQGFPTLVQILPGGKIGKQYQGERTKDKMKEWFYEHFAEHINSSQKGGSSCKKTHRKSKRRSTKSKRRSSKSKRRSAKSKQRSTKSKRRSSKNRRKRSKKSRKK